MRVNGPVEYPAQGHAIHNIAVNGKANDPSRNLSITTKTQYVRNTADSHRNRSNDHSESLA
jgi:hypothetical protein